MPSAAARLRVLNPMSRMIESAVTVMTVPSRLCAPGSFLREWLLLVLGENIFERLAGLRGRLRGWRGFGRSSGSDSYGFWSFWIGHWIGEVKALRRDPVLGYHRRGQLAAKLDGDFEQTSAGVD